MSDQQHIWNSARGSGGRNMLSDELLMAYFDGKLSDEEKHEVENWLADEGMESDALEGLSTLKPHETRQSVLKLNHQLAHNLKSKKKRRRKVDNSMLTYVAIGLILLLAVVAYLVITRYLK